MPHLLAFILLTTIAGLGDPFGTPPPTPVTQTFSQTVQLHPGWNLVSWHVVPVDAGIEIWMNEILPDISPLNDWFFDHGGKLHIYTDADPEHYYYNNPGYTQSAQWVWDLNHAYYIHLDISHPWFVNNRPRINLSTTTFDIEPNPAWSRQPATGTEPGWFFMGYEAPGYSKMATVYNTGFPGSGPPSGSPEYYDYRGPFHGLYWDMEEPDPTYLHYSIMNPPQYPPDQYLVIVKTDDGKVYLPFRPDAGGIFYKGEIDEIGVLEPGRGYFLGFGHRDDTNPGMEDFTWDGYPGWPEDQAPPRPLPTPPQTASSGHFQFQDRTHFFYPVFLDTVVLEDDTIAVGDQIGIFDGDLCVGAAVYCNSFPLKVNAWEDDIATPTVLDGYQVNAEMTFKLFDVSRNQEITFVPPPGPMSIGDNPIAPTHSGFGVGLYANRSLNYGIQKVNQLPQEYALKPNFPNPFNAETVIPLELPQRSKIILELFNVAGQKIALLFDGVKEAGWEKVKYNAAALPSGIYFLRVTAQGLERGGKFVDVGKMLVLK